MLNCMKFYTIFLNIVVNNLHLLQKKVLSPYHQRQCMLCHQGHLYLFLKDRYHP